MEKLSELNGSWKQTCIASIVKKMSFGAIGQNNYLGFTNSEMAPCVFLSSSIYGPSSSINCKNAALSQYNKNPAVPIHYAY